MTEWSHPFTNSLTDGGPISQASYWRIFRMLLGPSAEEADKGVIAGWDNDLAATSPGADQIDIDTGAAFCHGTPYENTASLTLTATRPSVNTTGKRVVLRKDIVNGGVRATVISSADGTATLPSLTQSESTYWDIPICSFTHATNGTIAALTDEREFLIIGGSAMPEIATFHTAAVPVARGATLVTTDVAWGTANEARYCPFVVTETVTIKSISIVNGGVSGNFDVGIYDADDDGKPRTRLISSGSTAQSGTNTTQTVNTADVTLTPGLYYVALVFNNTTGEVKRVVTIASGATAPIFMTRFGVFREGTAFPLPATATPLQTAPAADLSIPDVSLLRY